MGGADKVDLSTTQSDIAILQERGFILEKLIGEGSYAKVRTYTIMESKSVNVSSNNSCFFRFIGRLIWWTRLVTL